MLKDTELRLGNILQMEDDPEERVRVADIYKGVVNVKPLHPNSFEHEYPLDYLQGVPITEEELTRMGFKKDNRTLWLVVNGGDYYIELDKVRGEWYPDYCQCPEFSSVPEQRINLSAIQYMHQLQNLYYVLTGEELTFKS
ncbi:hypothetical protein Q4E40_02740 [Pontibacter sp. BT731]|uniref:hypothetical protein n=1 Tax=Pontibacter coccineus TaxID=3063328 RepID=UPI0026E1DF07|nr:hypothetical protein [Pontibacter sp. BT731]MDO6389030.1 hypothetical protein [Pontibacter sp. BT731]